MESSFDLSFCVRGTQAVSNEPSQARGAEEAALVITAKESAHFAAHEVHGSVAHKESAAHRVPLAYHLGTQALLGRLNRDGQRVSHGFIIAASRTVHRI